MVKTRSGGTDCSSSDSSFRVVRVRYEDTLAGHEACGRTIGEACRAQIVEAIAKDPEVVVLSNIAAVSKHPLASPEYAT